PLAADGSSIGSGRTDIATGAAVVEIRLLANAGAAAAAVRQRRRAAEARVSIGAAQVGMTGGSGRAAAIAEPLSVCGVTRALPSLRPGSIDPITKVSTGTI